jgi:hypothetical protein
MLCGVHLTGKFINGGTAGHCCPANTAWLSQQVARGNVTGVKNVAVVEGGRMQVKQIDNPLHTSLVTLLMQNLQAQAHATV